MNYKVEYTAYAFDEIKKLGKKTAKRVLDKIKFFSQQKDPLSFAKKLENPRFGTYRFRIGDYRAIFDIDRHGNITILLILSVKHRKDVYKF
jgi:mRNA interferase RelE/StbE